MTGEEHDFHAGLQLEDTFREFAADRFRHHNIGHQQIDWALMGPAMRQPSLPVPGLENHLPAVFQNRADESADCVFVFHQQDNFRALGHRSDTSSRLTNLVHRIRAYWQEDLECGPHTQLRFAAYHAAALFDNSQNRGETPGQSLCRSPWSCRTARKCASVLSPVGICKNRRIGKAEGLRAELKIHPFMAAALVR